MHLGNIVNHVILTATSTLIKLIASIRYTAVGRMNEKMNESLARWPLRIKKELFDMIS